MLSLQQKGDYMTLAQFAVILRHGLVAPIFAGVITAVIAGWRRSRK